MRHLRRCRLRTQVGQRLHAAGRERCARTAPKRLHCLRFVADPLPQALVLTAIVIGFATTGFVIELALRSRHESGTDHVDGVREDDRTAGSDEGLPR